MQRTYVLLGCLALGSFTLSACGGKKTLDVEKLPCKERRPTSSIAGAGYIACTGPDKDIDVGNGMVCKAGATLGVYTKTKTVYECWVKTPVKLDGVSCTGGVQLYPEGKLRRCQLDAELARKDLAIPKGSWVTFTAEGDMRRIELPTPAALGALKCKGYMNFVYANGKPNRCELAEPATVDGQAKKAGEAICLDEGGKLADCSKYSFSAL